MGFHQAIAPLWFLSALLFGIGAFHRFKSLGSIGKSMHLAGAFMAVSLAVLSLASLFQALGGSWGFVSGGFVAVLAPGLWTALAFLVARTRYHERLEARMRELATINSISRAVGKTLDISKMVKIALSHIVVRTSLTGGAVYLFDDETSALTVAGTCRLPKNISCSGPQRRLWEKLHREALDKDEIIACGIPGIEDSAGLEGLVENLGCSALAIVPLRLRKKPVGTMGFFGVDSIAEGMVGRDFLIAVGGQISTAIENAKLFESERQGRQFLEALELISEAGLASTGLDAMLNELIKRIIAKMGLYSGSIFILNESSLELEARATWGLGGDSEVRLKLGEGLSGMVVKEGRQIFILDAQTDPQITSFRLKKEHIHSMMGVPLTVGDKVIGALHVDSREIHRFTQDEIRLLEAMAGRASLAIENANLYEKLRNSYLHTVMSLTKAVEAKDTHTLGHSEEVAIIARTLAYKLGLEQEIAEEIYYAGLLHDVGKIGTPERILTKPGALTKEEYEQVKLHTLMGYEIVKPVAGLNGIRKLVLMHHERFDGKGYPHCLGGSEIPLGARIMAVADSFQAMVSNRPYRHALSVDSAVEEVKKCSGSQFDPLIVEAFLELADENYFFKLSAARRLKSEPYVETKRLGAV